MMKSDKSRLTVFLIAFFFGMLGIHRMYVGKIGSGIIQLILTISFIGVFVTSIWVLIDWIMILTGEFTDSQGRKIVK